MTTELVSLLGCLLATFLNPWKPVNLTSLDSAPRPGKHQLEILHARQNLLGEALVLPQ